MSGFNINIFTSPVPTIPDFPAITSPKQQKQRCDKISDNIPSTSSHSADNVSHSFLAVPSQNVRNTPDSQVRHHSEENHNVLSTTDHLFNANHNGISPMDNQSPRYYGSGHNVLMPAYQQKLSSSNNCSFNSSYLYNNLSSSIDSAYDGSGLNFQSPNTSDRSSNSAHTYDHTIHNVLLPGYNAPGHNALASSSRFGPGYCRSTFDALHNLSKTSNEFERDTSTKVQPEGAKVPTFITKDKTCKTSHSDNFSSSKKVFTDVSNRSKLNAKGLCNKDPTSTITKPNHNVNTKSDHNVPMAQTTTNHDKSVDSGQASSPGSTNEEPHPIVTSTPKENKTITKKDRKDTDPDAKPPHSYIALISMAILSTEDKKLLLCDIYEYIMDNYKYYKLRETEKAWRNSIRHNLSLNECFIKDGRSDNGKGNYWAIHPACVNDFKKGDYRRRNARRRAKRSGAILQTPRYHGYSTYGYVPMSTLPTESGYAQPGRHYYDTQGTNQDPPPPNGISNQLEVRQRHVSSHGNWSLPWMGRYSTDNVLPYLSSSSPAYSQQYPATARSSYSYSNPQSNNSAFEPVTRDTSWTSWHDSTQK